MAATGYGTALTRGRPTRRRLLSGGAVAGAAVFVAACGGSSKSSEQASSGGGTPNSTAGVAATASVGADPVYGGILNIRDARNMSIDPLIDSTSAANIFGSYIYSRLAKFKAYNDPEKSANYEVEPDLASWEQP